MNINYRNDVSSNHMIVEEIKNFSADNFGIKILTHNKIKGLLPVDYETINGKTNLIYDIYSKQSLEDFRKSSKISYELYKNIIFSLSRTINNIKEYLLDVNGLLLKKDCVFLDIQNGRMDFCYNPFYDGNITDEVREFLSGLLSLIDYGDPKVVRLAYDTQKVTASERFTMEDVIAALSKAVSDIDNQNGFYQQSDYKHGLSDNEIRKDFLCDNNISAENNSKPSGQKNGSVFLEKARIYFKDREAGEIFDDINELKIIKKIRNINIENQPENDKKISKIKEVYAEKKTEPDLPRGINDIAEELDKSGVYDDYRMI